MSDEAKAPEPTVPETGMVLKPEEMGLSQAQSKMVIEKTPRKYVKQRKGPGGMMLDYVEGGYFVQRLNEIFNYMWSFKILQKTEKGRYIEVHGELTAYIIVPVPGGQPIVQAIVKDQYGGAEIKMARDGSTPVDPTNDAKAAATDAMKKCASLFGIAQDVYWKQEKNAPQTAQQIVYGDQPSTASRGGATESQIKWIRSLVETGKIVLDKPVEQLTFQEASKAISDYRANMGK